jgi:hypothetical protein
MYGSGCCCCVMWRSPGARGGGLESYSMFGCMGAPGIADVRCTLPLLPTDPESPSPVRAVADGLDIDL